MSLISVVPITDVSPDPHQPRTYFKESALKALATSILKTGQRQPITVRKRRAGAKAPYEIIDGERRWRACGIAGIKTIRIDIEERELEVHSEQHLLSLASNFMREGHTHTEISNALHYQVEAAIAAGQTRGQAVQSIMEAVGKSEAWVYNYLTLQGLHVELQALMHPDTPDKTRLRMNEAVVVAALPEAKQKPTYRAMLKVIPSARVELARKLSAEVTGEPRLRKQGEITGNTNRFIARMSAEVERVLDYKDADFVKALGSVPATTLQAFRANLALLLDSVDRAGKGGRR